MITRSMVHIKTVITMFNDQVWYYLHYKRSLSEHRHHKLLLIKSTSSTDLAYRKSGSSMPNYVGCMCIV